MSLLIYFSFYGNLKYKIFKTEIFYRSGSARFIKDFDFFLANTESNSAQVEEINFKV